MTKHTETPWRIEKVVNSHIEFANAIGVTDTAGVSSKGE